MTHLKNWLPDMDHDEHMWFDKCPKSVLFEICRQFGMRVADDFSAEGAFAVMRQEWEVLHQQGIVPQKPFNVERANEKRAAYKARTDALDRASGRVA